MRIDKKTLLLSSILLLTTTTPAMAWYGEKEIIDVKVSNYWYGDDDKGLDSTPHENTGYGASFQYLVNKPNQDVHWVGFGGGFFKDQYDENAFYTDLIYKYRLKFDNYIQSIEFNAKLGIYNRTYRTLDNSAIGFSDEKENRFSLYPNISVFFTDNLHLDFEYMPTDWGSNITDGFETFSVSLGYRL